ncbi:hypothetical protein BIW11_13049 [Tropilaelaps mercedesae]|uniref:RNase H type-1 domain-containing protein n=1 Tax=Tropilaelaps mercedesae TaxID=418985 RepID=A0A1V9X3Z1_9ACAR|nr:hypothetical protein BIW11_13049 [Tropilaelaps mercedesae]
MAGISSVVNFMIDPHSMVHMKNRSQAKIQEKFEKITSGYDLILACDASYKDGVASIGITDGKERWHFRVDNYLGPTIAELIAILQALRLALTEFEHPERLLIATDCRTILMGLESAKKKKRISQALAAVNFGLSWFCKPCDVMLLWVPGHKGLSLNVIADDNARCARQLPEDVEGILPLALRNRETRWCRRETCDLVECSDDSQLARHRDVDQILIEMSLKQSLLNADQHYMSEFPEFAWCELCRECGKPGELQTFEHIFFDCEALHDERGLLRTEFVRLSLPFESQVVLDGYCIDATAKFIDSVKAMKRLYVD